MSFLASILKGIHSFSKIKNKVGGIENLKPKHFFKVARDSFLTFCIIALLFIAVIVGLIWSITGAVGDLFNSIMGLNGSSTPPTSSFYEQLSEEEVARLIDETGASLDPRKVAAYMKKEASSVPNSIKGKRIIEESDGVGPKRTSSQEVNINISDYANKYKLNWEFIAAVDLATFKAEDIEEMGAINGADSLFPVFTWESKYSRDTTDYWRSWVEQYEYDPTTKKTTKVKDTYAKSKEQYKLVKEPIAIPSKVSTLFGDYIYTVTEDVVLRNDDWSSPFVIKEEKSTRQEIDKYVDDKTKPKYGTKKVIKVKGLDTDKTYNIPIDINTTFKKDSTVEYKYAGTDGDYYVYTNGWWLWKTSLLIKKSDIPYDEAKQSMVFHEETEEKIIVGYEQKPVYKTITITTKTMKKVKQKVVQDQVANVRQSFDPSKFIQYLNSNEISVDDLELIREIMLNIPSGNVLLENIERIINGDYGDISNLPGGGGSSPGIDLGDFDSGIPLYIQWDERWKNHPYAGSNVGRAGCGVTSMSMVMSGLGADISSPEIKKYDTNNDGILDPREVANYSTDKGHYVVGAGTAKSLYADLGGKTGLKVKMTYNPTEVYDSLKLGKVIIASMKPGHFTQGSHLIVLTGLDSNGKVYVNDPNSRERSSVTWDYNIIKAEASDYQIIENPNFVTEKFEATSYYTFTYEDAEKIGTPEAMKEAQLQGGNDVTSLGVYLGDKDLRHKLIAVDPKKIAYRSKVYITFPNEVKQMTMPDGTKVSLDGYYSAVDTGGAIKKNRIDVYMGAWRVNPQYKSLAYQFGRRNVTIRYRAK